LSDKNQKLRDFRRDGFLSAGAFYSLLALYMPLAVLTALVFLLKEFLPEHISFPAAFLLASGFLAALAASFYCDFMKDIKASRVAANIRGGFIIMAVFYFFSSVTSLNVPLRLRFLPNLVNILVTIETLYLWVSVITLKQIFNARVSFEKYTQKYRGDELRMAMVEESSLIQYTDLNISKARRNYTIELALVCAITLTGIIYGYRIPPGLYILLAVIMAGGVFISAFFGIIRREHYYAGEGLAFSAADRFKRMIGVAVFTVFAIIAAVLLSSDKSILPFSVIAAFFAWLLGLFPSMTAPEQPRSQEMIPQTTPDDQILFQDLMQNDTSPWEGWKYVRYGFIAFLALVFIWFLISPLFNRGYNPYKLPFFLKLKRIIAEFAKGVVSILASISNYMKSAPGMRKLRKPGADEIRRAAESLLGAYSYAKKRDIRKSATLFARLIIWGSDTRLVTWKPSYAPGEYCHLLASRGEDHSRNDIIRCGEIFEKALYSADELTAAERNEFKSLIEEITSSAF